MGIFLKMIQLAVVIACYNILCVNSDYSYIAVAEFEGLLKIHMKVVDNLRQFITEEEKILVILKRFLGNFKREQELLEGNGEKYFANPINCFKLLKMLTSDLTFLNLTIGSRSNNKINCNNLGSNHPSYTDLKEAAKGISRLQDVYGLNTTELSEGKIKGVTQGHPMTASDCFELGLALIREKYYKTGILWLEEAKRKLPKYYINIFEKQIQEYIILTKQALDGNGKLIFDGVQEGNAKKNKNLLGEDLDQCEDEPKHRALYGSKVKELCNGKNFLPVNVSSSLKCRYLFKNHHFTTIAPLKVEQMYPPQPEVLLIYDVISDREIEYIKLTSIDKFKIAKVGVGKKFEIETSLRAGKQHWMPVNDSVVKKITRRGGYITGLNVEPKRQSRNQLQIVNYGVGGHYAAHTDYFITDDNIQGGNPYGIEVGQDRVATVLFYMSKVEAGGATVFPELGFGVKPTKNAAIYWENLYPSGYGRKNTLHASCPVLVGSKWIATQWIEQNSQEFIRPCNLLMERDD